MRKLIFLNREKQLNLLFENSEFFTVVPVASSNLAIVSAQDEEVSLTWDAVATADSYTIKYSNLTTGDPEVEVTGILTNSTTISGLNNRDEYEFTVVSVQSGVDSANSNTVSATITDTTAPNPPTALTKDSATAETFIVSATASNSTDVASYNAYLDGIQVQTGILEAALASGYEFTGLTAETTYDFQFTAVDLSGNESALSTALTDITETGITSALTTTGDWTQLSGTTNNNYNVNSTRFAYTASINNSRRNYAYTAGGRVFRNVEIHAEFKITGASPGVYADIFGISVAEDPTNSDKGVIMVLTTTSSATRLVIYNDVNTTGLGTEIFRDNALGYTVTTNEVISMKLKLSANGGTIEFKVWRRDTDTEPVSYQSTSETALGRDKYLGLFTAYDVQNWECVRYDYL